MKPTCTMTWVGSTLPIGRLKLAQTMRQLRNGKGFVFRLRHGQYRAVINGCDFVAAINTRA